ncbi:MAG: XRE family transcriptional regulator [Sulfurovum sp.]|nr:XRE family transcriptional regulator [Sulfurovum sp.]
MIEFFKSINLSRQAFADMTNLSYSTIGNWHDDNKPIPGWVASWLNNYIEKKRFENIKNTLRESGVCDEK